MTAAHVDAWELTHRQVDYDPSEVTAVTGLVPTGDEHWRTRAACAGTPVADFYPDLPGHDSLKAVAAVKVRCAACPVAGDCLMAGLGEYYGVWGGTSPRERKLLRRRLAIRRFRF